MERPEQSELPVQFQERVSDELTVPEREMLRWELDPNRESAWPMTERGWFARWLFRLLGLGDLMNHIDLELTRVQRLLTLIHQLQLGTGRDHEALNSAFAQTNLVLGQEAIPQINRQTGAISSLLDRLQFYERNITLINRSRKQYDKILAKKVAEREARLAAEKAAEQGITVGDQPDSEQLPLEAPDDALTGIDTPALTLLTDGDETPMTSDEATDGDEPN